TGPGPGRGPAAASRLHPELFQVELALEGPEEVVVDDAAVAHHRDRLALGVDDRAPDLPVLHQLLLGRAARLLQLVEVLRAVEVGRAQLVEQGPVARPLGVQLVRRACCSSPRPSSSPPSPTHRITSGSVRPWPTSVTTMTVKVITRTASRAGTGDPLGRVAGTASAAASETTPRMPAHDRTTISAGRSGGRRRRSRSHPAMPPIHSARTAMSAPLTASPAPTSASSAARSSARAVPAIWSPIRTNTNPFRRKISISQTARPASRTSELIMVDARRPRYSPAVTAASTPEIPASSAGRYAAYGVASETVTSTGRSVSRVRTWAISHPTASPIAVPPTATMAKRLPGPSTSPALAATAATRAAR